MRYLPLLALAACTASEVDPIALSIAPPPGGCYDPAAYGAVPDDGIDDHLAIQAAIDAAGAAGGGSVCLGPGRFTVNRADLHAIDRFAALAFHSPRVTLRGQGERQTVISLEGDQGAGTTMVLSVDGVDGIHIQDLGFDTSLATNTDEQTHVIRVVGPADGTAIERVEFNHPHPAISRSGDCIQLIGNGPAPGATTPNDIVRNTRIVGVTFDTCARSDLMIQRGVQGLLVSGSTFRSAGDTPIDSEPTSYGTVSDIAIVGNTFPDVGELGSTYAATFAGWDQPARNIVVTGNMFARRGIAFYRTSNVTITGNVMSASAGRVLLLENTASNVVVSSNVIHEQTATNPDYALYVANHGSNSGTASHVVIQGNEIINDNAVGGVWIAGATDVSFVNNDVQGTVAAPAFMALLITPSIVDVDSVMVSNNRFASPGWKAAVWMSQLSAGYPYHFGRVSVVGNMSRGTTYGLVCNTPATTFAGSVVSVANNWSGSTVCSTPITAGN
jgi:hypothetical protein